MALFQEINLGTATFSNGTSAFAGNPTIIAGSCTTRATVIAEVPAALSIGSVYLSYAGKMYIKVANTATPAATDWQVVSTTAAD